MDTYVKLFTDTNIIINGLKNLLDTASIHFIVKDRFESARLGGFGESLASVEIHVLEQDLEKAEKVLTGYREKINA
jgi:hypothetical protein